MGYCLLQHMLTLITTQVLYWKVVCLRGVVLVPTHQLIVITSFVWYSSFFKSPNPPNGFYTNAH